MGLRAETKRRSRAESCSWASCTTVFLIGQIARHALKADAVDNLDPRDDEPGAPGD
jgi:hypothetical protein